jgi:hypothetical protein
VHSQNCEKWLLTLSCLSVRPHGTTRLQLEGFSWIWYLNIFSKISREFNFHYNLTRITGALHKDLCTFMKISRWILLRMRHVSDRENQNTHLVLNNISRKSYLLCNNVQKCSRDRQDTNENIMRRIGIACWITKAPDTHSEYVICIAFPWQQYLRERALMLCLYVHCLSCVRR